MLRQTADKAFGMLLVSVAQNLVALLDHMFSLPSMNLSGRKQNKTRMVMMMVVPVKELASPSASVFDGVEMSRKIRPILHRLELRFRKRVVIRRVRT